MKKAALALSLLSASMFADGIESAILKKLVQKGILSENEASEILKEAKEQTQKDELKAKTETIKELKVKSSTNAITVGGTHFFGYTFVNPAVKNSLADDSAGFESRRNHLQAKLDLDGKNHFFILMDATKEIATATRTTVKDAATSATVYTYDKAGNVTASPYFKFAYLWLDSVLPNTGVEIGFSHRPWINYEENNAWFYRSINKIAMEDKTTASSFGPGIMNSSDLGFNFKTATPYFSSEIGLFNGEGFDSSNNANNQTNTTKLSFEARATAHLMGGGDKKVDKMAAEYANISLTTLQSPQHKDDNLIVRDGAEYDRSMLNAHFVYNNPHALFSAQYYTLEDKPNNASSKKSNGYSLNGEFRPLKPWTLLARYDHLETKQNGAQLEKGSQFIYGVSYDLSRYAQFILSGKDVNAMGIANDKKVYMLTTELKW
jgi:hypothetical protein